MRRARSETIEAANFSELLKLSQIPKAASRSRARKSLPAGCLYPQSSSHKSCVISENPYPIQKKSKEVSKPSSTTAEYWDDMDFNSQEAKSETSTATASRSNISVHKSSLESENDAHSASDDDENEPKVDQQQMMIIGAKGSGRHMLVDGLLNVKTEESQKHGIRTSFDLIVKKEQSKDQESVNLYKFWIKDAERHGFDYLFKTYYKSVGIYVFVYQVADRNSFQCLDRAISQAKQERNGEKFIGVLIGGKKGNEDDSERVVTREEGEALKEKYGLLKFSEQDFESEEEKISLVDIMTN